MYLNVSELQSLAETHVVCLIHPSIDRHLFGIRACKVADWQKVLTFGRCETPCVNQRVEVGAFLERAI